jgi:hypothetical protein
MHVALMLGGPKPLQTTRGPLVFGHTTFPHPPA